MHDEHLDADDAQRDVKGRNKIVVEVQSVCEIVERLPDPQIQVNGFWVSEPRGKEQKSDSGKKDRKTLCSRECADLRLCAKYKGHSQKKQVNGHVPNGEHRNHGNMKLSIEMNAEVALLTPREVISTDVND